MATVKERIRLKSKNKIKNQQKQWENDFNNASFNDVDYRNDFNASTNTQEHIYQNTYNNHQYNANSYSQNYRPIENENLGYQKNSLNDIREGFELYDNKKVSENVVSTKVHKRLSLKAKVHITIYLSLVALVLTLIISNFYLAQVDKTVIAESAPVSISVNMSDRASRLYMGNDNSVKEIPLVPIVNYEAETAPTNWFDKVCSNIENISA